MTFGYIGLELRRKSRSRKAAIMTTKRSALILTLLTASAVAQQEPPYPMSTIITGLTWADATTIVHQATGSDNWPITWADDGEQYTAYGDGWGFDPKVPAKLSLGFARVSGGPPGTGTNIRSASGEQKGDGRSGKKASGMLMVEGTLYTLVRNANNNGEQSQLAWSSDYAATWTWSSWKFAELGYPCFLNFGRNYAGARDDYVYVYSPDTPSAYNETDTIVLARVPKQSVTIKTAYEFFSGFDANGNPTWSSDINQRKAVFTFPGGCNRIDVTYNAPLKRYLLVTRSRARAGGKDQFAFTTRPGPGDRGRLYSTSRTGTWTPVRAHTSPANGSVPTAKPVIWSSQVRTASRCASSRLPPLRHR